MATRTMNTREARETAGLDRKAVAIGVAIGTTLGALGMYLLDPRSGRRRRARVRDRITAARNGAGREISERMTSLRDARRSVASPSPLTDDQAITERVMSRVFHDPALAKSGVSVSTVGRVVYLRGHVDDDATAAEIERRVRQVDGIREVVNLIDHPELDPANIQA